MTKKKRTGPTDEEELARRTLGPVLKLITKDNRLDIETAAALAWGAGLDPGSVLARAVAAEAAHRVLDGRARSRGNLMRDTSIVLLWRTCQALRAAWKASWAETEAAAASATMETTAAGNLSRFMAPGTQAPERARGPGFRAP